MRMKDLMQKIQDLMNELNKDQAIQMSEQFEKQNWILLKKWMTLQLLNNWKLRKSQRPNQWIE